MARIKKEVMPSVLVWLRSVGIGSVFLGGVGMMSPDFFVFAASLVYAGLALVAVDVVYEPTLAKGWKALILSAVGIAFPLFSWLVVFVPAPLDVRAVFTAAEFPKGTLIGGIPWKAGYTELTVVISNPTDSTYDDINLFIHPDHPVAAAAQETDLPGISIQDSHARGMRLTIDGKVVDLAIVANDAGYNINCARLPARGIVKLVFALVDIKEGRRDDTAEVSWLDAPKPAFVLREVDDGKAAYWWAHPENQQVFGSSPPIPRTVHVSGSYVGRLRQRAIEVELALPVKQH